LHASESLQWQTGARTIYALSYPDLEVRSGLNDAVHKGLMGDASLANLCKPVCLMR